MRFSRDTSGHTCPGRRRQEKPPLSKTYHRYIIPVKSDIFMDAEKTDFKELLCVFLRSSASILISANTISLSRLRQVECLHAVAGLIYDQDVPVDIEGKSDWSFENAIHNFFAAQCP